jgi:hypothetical protein
VSVDWSYLVGEAVTTVLVALWVLSFRRRQTTPPGSGRVVVTRRVPPAHRCLKPSSRGLGAGSEAQCPECRMRWVLAGRPLIWMPAVGPAGPAGTSGLDTCPEGARPGPYDDGEAR